MSAQFTGLPDVRFQELFNIQHDHETNEKLKKIQTDEEQNDFHINLLSVLAEISFQFSPYTMRTSDIAHAKEIINIITLIYTDKPPSAPCLHPGCLSLRDLERDDDDELSDDVEQRGFPAILIHAVAPRDMSMEGKLSRNGIPFRHLATGRHMLTTPVSIFVVASIRQRSCRQTV